MRTRRFRYWIIELASGRALINEPGNVTHHALSVDDAYQQLLRNGAERVQIGVKRARKAFGRTEEEIRLRLTEKELVRRRQLALPLENTERVA